MRERDGHGPLRGLEAAGVGGPWHPGDVAGSRPTAGSPGGAATGSPVTPRAEADVSPHAGPEVSPHAGPDVSSDASPRVSTEELVEAVRDRMPQILRGVCDELMERTPEYGEFLQSQFDQVAEAGRSFVGELLERAEQSDGRDAVLPEGGVEHMLFEEIGRAQSHAGQDVSDLLSAYRTGARVAWTHIADAALALRVEPHRLAVVATALFTAIDQISAASLSGYLLERQDEVRRRDRERQELAELLLSDRAAHSAVQAAADRVGWRLPRRLAVVLVDPHSDAARAAIDRLDDSCLRLHRREVLVGIVPDPVGPGQRRRLVRALEGAGAVVGPDVRPDQLPASLHLAHAAVRLVRTGVLRDDPLFVADHVDALIVHQNPRLLAYLRAQCLAPLDAVSENTRERLAETLVSWLTNLGDRRAVAEALGVHPHTVTYRLGQLRELLGERLDDAHGRAVLMLALAWGEPVLHDTAEGSGLWDRSHHEDRVSAARQPVGSGDVESPRGRDGWRDADGPGDDEDGSADESSAPPRTGTDRLRRAPDLTAARSARPGRSAGSTGDIPAQQRRRDRTRPSY